MGAFRGDVTYTKVVAHSPAADSFPTTRGIVATTAGTITGVMGDGSAVTSIPVVVGSNPYQMTKISAASASLGLFLGY